ncbi:MAG: hypothetical protein KBA31_21170 [Alphaproteobacteria bacterium]|nr:hypothetical protein [Alphaproteobacteria bacterium]
MVASNLKVMAAAEFDLRDEKSVVQARIFAPEWNEKSAAWECRFEIDPPFQSGQAVFGETGLQALSLALKLLSSTLYSSDLYRKGRLGAFGEFGGYLGIPAPKESLSHAPFPF